MLYEKILRISCQIGPRIAGHILSQNIYRLMLYHSYVNSKSTPEFASLLHIKSVLNQDGLLSALFYHPALAQAVK